MKAEVTAIIETAPEGGFWAICPEFPGATVKEKPSKKQKRILGKLLS